MRFLAAVLSGLVLASSALAREPGFGEYRAVKESLQSVHPRFVPRWLKEHGYDPTDFMPRPWTEPDSLGLVLRGKWGRGRSVEVTGQDSLLFLSLGSEIAIVSFFDPAQPRILTELQLGFCPTQTYVADSLLVTGGYSCIETWSLSDISHPAFRGRIPYRVGDFCVRDSFLFFVSYDDDSFRVWSIADPAVPRQLGACRDGGWATTVSGNTVVLVLHDGFGFMDVSNPRAPVRVGFYGGNSIAAKARGTICCISKDEGGSPATASFEVLDIANPAAPYRLSKLTASGGYDIELSDTLAFVSGWQQPYGEFCIIGISDSAHPHKFGTYTTPGDNWGVWASPARHRAFIADWRRGLCVLDVSSLANPVLDTTMLVADQAEDIFVQGNLAYVADYGAGLRVLDVSDPSRPFELGGIDSLSSFTQSATARDSFAYIGWAQPPFLRSIDVTDPSRPRTAGGCQVFGWPEDMVLRDSLLYVAQAYRFQVVNVARPREPVLVGSCVLSATGTDIVLQDTLAYVAALKMVVINVAQPDSPSIVNAGFGTAEGLDVVDTIAYLAHDGLWAASVANPDAPYVLDSVSVTDFITDVVVRDTLAILSGRKVYTFSVADPRDIRLLGSWTAPGWAYRLLYQPPYIYAACYDAGVCILETTETGLQEPATPKACGTLAVLPSVTAGPVRVVVRGSGGTLDLKLFDAVGKEVMRVAAGPGKPASGSTLPIDLTSLPDGVYVLRGKVGGETMTAKVIKTVRR